MTSYIECVTRWQYIFESLLCYEREVTLYGCINEAFFLGGGGGVLNMNSVIKFVIPLSQSKMNNNQ